ncbi:BTAD domain-containing putative transcriptional regulator [Kitasatospora sp. NPDC017646]|uniref:BTAD domain-containing putative transcriptional regulator n=1 Tax=Kitasatospora sp. NPDC017646 TaxID=3364024 RepID=UPI0037BAF266
MADWRTGGRARLRALAGMGHRATDGGEHPLAARAFGEALALRRGDGLRGGPDQRSTRRHGRGVGECPRFCAPDQRIEADLRLGHHRVLPAEQSVLVDRHRTHESLHGQDVSTRESDRTHPGCPRRTGRMSVRLAMMAV